MLENSIEISGYTPVEIATTLSTQTKLRLVQVFNKILNDILSYVASHFIVYHNNIELTKLAFNYK